MQATNPSHRLSREGRRRGFLLAYLNAGLWAFGNGLTSTSLILYLALAFGAEGIAVSLIIAAPQLMGVLRLASPAIIAWTGARRLLASALFVLSSLVLLALPLVVLSQRLPPACTLPTIIALWAVYHLLEYIAVIALWSYLRDLAPQRMHGRFLGRRERWLVIGTIVGMVLAGLFSLLWRYPDAASLNLPPLVTSAWNTIGEALSVWQQYLPETRWVAYALPAVLGAVLMLLSAIPVALLPGLQGAAQAESSSSGGLSLIIRLRQACAPLSDRKFCNLLAFIMWFSFANGITQAPQGMFPYRVLDLTLLTLLALRSGMMGGQSTLAPWTGRLIDRLGDRPVLIVSLLIVATGPLFYLAAGKLHIAWIAGAYLVWIAYVGLNIGLPHVTWRLSGPHKASAYLAWHFALSGLAYSLGSLLGGATFDWLLKNPQVLTLSTTVLDPFSAAFLLGWILRTLGVFWLIRLR